MNCSETVNVTPGKHYLFVYIWGNSFQSGSGWADDSYTLTGGNENLLIKTQSSASNYYSGRIVTYVTATSNRISFSKTTGTHRGMVGSLIVIQLL